MPSSNERQRDVGGPGPAPTVRDRLRALRPDLTPAETRVVTVLLDDYPLAGIQPVVGLAAAAGVSAPTVLRLLTKGGFSGYRQFRDSLTAELAGGRSFTPLTKYPDLGRDGEPMLDRARRMLAEGVSASLAGLDTRALDRTVGWLAEPARPVWITGGKFSAVLASYLADYLQLLRPGVALVAPTIGDRERALLDIATPAVCVTFDYRRYQSDTVVFGRRASAAGAHLVVLTDPYLSPLVDRADAVLTSIVNGPSPYDALTPAFAVVETIVALVTERIGAAAGGRLERFEQWQREDNDGRAPL